MKKLEHNYIARLALFRKIFKEASKNLKCPHCDRKNPVIQKLAKICGKIEVKHSVLYFFFYLEKLKSHKTRSREEQFNQQIEKAKTSFIS